MLAAPTAPKMELCDSRCSFRASIVSRPTSSYKRLAKLAHKRDARKQLYRAAAVADAALCETRGAQVNALVLRFDRLPLVTILVVRKQPTRAHAAIYLLDAHSSTAHKHTHTQTWKYSSSISKSLLVCVEFGHINTIPL